jgi:hypothetical protein
MRPSRCSRWLLLVLLALLLPASSFAGVFISVGFAPPVLPIYDQPPCPDEGLMWMPGYWAYGPEGYYWVPGAWVPAPYDGALWTPPYWGWEGGLYMFHPGYWGPHVGYYGGVNYGFGYMGVGFVGGMWRGHDFVYNTAVMHVNERVIHTTYVDRTIVQRNTIVNDRHIAYNGGPGGINHPPGQNERLAEHDQHMQPTSFQQQHMQAAQTDRNSYARNNGGRPQQVVTARPLPAEHAAPPQLGQRNPGTNNSNPGNPGFNNNAPRTNPGNSEVRPVPQNREPRQPQPQPVPAPQYRTEPQARPAPQSQPAPQFHTQPQSRPAPPPQPAPQSRPAPQFHTEPQRSQPQPQVHSAPEQRSAPPPHAEQQARPAPQMHSAPPPQPRPAPQPHNEPRGDEHGHGR